MTIHTVSTTSLFNAISPTSNGYDWIQEGVTVASSLSSGVYGENISSAVFDIHGALFGYQSALYLKDASNNNSVTIASTGNVIGATSATISLGGHSNQVWNAGEISTHSLQAVYFGGENNSLVNTGTITSSSNSLFFGSVVYFSQANGARVINSGVLSTSTSAAAIKLFSSATDAAYIENTGQILAVDNAVQDTGDGDTTVINRGHISGDIDLGGGNDIFDGRKGTIEGTVSGGEGNDTYIIDTADVAIFEEFGVDGGIDTVRSTVTYDLSVSLALENLNLIGSADIKGAGNWLENTLNGNSGDNRLSGYFGNDTLNGKLGDDILRGGTQNDTLDGGEGNDKLFGGAHNDKLTGGSGDDILRGGAGKDKLTGGEGNDVFLFVKKSDSLNGKTADQITDFEKSVDVIDLSGLVPGDFDLSLNGHFSGSGPSVSTKVIKKNTQVLIDLDGDTTADMKILLSNVKGLTDLDFIL